MSKALDLAAKLDEALYQVYNPQEEKEEKELTGKDIHRSTFDSEQLRNVFIGTLMTKRADNLIDSLRAALDKMPDEWVAEFLRVVNGDVVEKISESVEETVTLPKKELENKMFKVFNILISLEDAEAGDIDFDGLKGIQKQQGHEITSKELMDYFKEYGVDIE